MDLQATKQIDIDVSNHKYISLDAKQYDRNLRYILITCYREGELLPINKNTCFASIRYRKPDEYGVFNSCEITQDGKILVELTEQMLAVAGTCYADVVIHKNVELVTDIGTTIVNVDDKDLEVLKLEDLHNNEIISTMTFIVYVHEAAFDNEEVESSYEYNKLNDLIAKAENTYVNVMNSCNESEANAATSEANAKTSETKAKTSETNAKTSEDNALISKTKAKVSEDNAKASENAAKESETNAATSETNAKTSEDNAKASENAAATSEVNAKTSETNAKTSETNAATSETNALNDANRAQSYAVGGTGARTGEDEDNARYYYDLVKTIAGGIEGGFIPIGTITFAELATAEKVTGYVYNISTDFTTDANFAEGEGVSYMAGTNVYCRSDGLWDCLGGSTFSIATVDEVIEYLGI